jgi:D-glycero-alpha-D-manno-heptose-7-phosphate kinase
MNRRVVFVYSGKSRLSGDIHAHVYGALRENRGNVRQAFEDLTCQAYDGRDAFRRGDYMAVCQLVNASWHSQRMLHESVSNAEIEVLFECALRNGAVAGKAGGAGGGGVLMFLAKDDKSRAPLIEALTGCIERQQIDDARILDCRILA